MSRPGKLEVAVSPHAGCGAMFCIPSEPRQLNREAEPKAILAYPLGDAVGGVLGALLDGVPGRSERTRYGSVDVRVWR